MGNCTNKQDSPKSLSLNGMHNQAFFGKEFLKNQNGISKESQHKQSIISTTDNNTNSIVTSSSFINMQQHEGAINGKNMIKSIQQYNNLEEIEELESSNYFQSEIRTLQEENIGFSNRLISTINIPSPEKKYHDQHILKQNFAHNNSPQQDTKSAGVYNSSQLQSNNTSFTQENSPTRTNRSNLSPRSREKKKTTSEIRNIIKMQTESYYQSLTSEELNSILQQGEKMNRVLQHFEFSNNDQVLDLVRDIYNSIINKKNKLSEIVLPEHREMVMQFIHQSYLLLDRGIQQLLKTQKRLINITSSNTGVPVRQSNMELSVYTLEVLVEAYQIIQYFQLHQKSHSYIPMNKWWAKHQNEKDLSSFNNKFIRLSQQLNAEFQDITPGLPNKNKNITYSKQNSQMSSNLSEDGDQSSRVAREDETKRDSLCKSNNGILNENSQNLKKKNEEGKEEQIKISSFDKKNPTNYLPLKQNPIMCDISNERIEEHLENEDEEEEKHQNTTSFYNTQNEQENVESLNESDFPCKTKINHQIKSIKNNNKNYLIQMNKKLN
ncbi:hypothetical protein TTHERM_00664070 (macronuclear) [Tetrahymena thermophila SB210]|uniref:Uncharacterized protein n=1 Tax=Tetrahymena thermophila (strain SB210) TaxID=312017 RepID=I7MFJ0_TETTS|nr:hypothetical protein TTHERM_00664070 [Tetrahymena thermophila SB210]EAR99928.1 hypothetical protein TTHERM_00664070 [Tetrahymena thermophila SB210]|eukprot:XP_001020173.1 hypothetical protein TTHERM_00664070 [Tetrahymena thermophila SB210]